MKKLVKFNIKLSAIEFTKTNPSQIKEEWEDVISAMLEDLSLTPIDDVDVQVSIEGTYSVLISICINCVRACTYETDIGLKNQVEKIKSLINEEFEEYFNSIEIVIND